MLVFAAPGVAFGQEQEPTSAPAQPSAEERVGWSIATVGGTGQRLRNGGNFGDAWSSGLEIGFSAVVLNDDVWQFDIFGGVRAMAYGLDEPREPNAGESYMGLGGVIAMPIHIGSESVSAVIRPAGGLLASREGALNPPVWVQAGLSAGVSIRVFADYQLTLTGGADAWIPLSNTDTTLFATLRLGLEHTWSRHEQREINPSERLDELETDQLADLIERHHDDQCTLAAVPVAWADAGDADSACRALVRPIESGSCALFVGTADSNTDVDMRAFAGADAWESAAGTAVEDQAADSWPVTLLCAFSGDLTPHLWIRRASPQRTSMTIRRYDNPLERLGLGRVDAGHSLSAPGCIGFHVAGSHGDTTVSLPIGDGSPLEVRVFAPEVASIRARLLEQGVVGGERAILGINMHGTSWTPYVARPRAGANDHFQPTLQVRDPDIGAAVVVCVRRPPIEGAPGTQSPAPAGDATPPEEQLPSTDDQPDSDE